MSDWHLDKRVPIALIVTLMLQAAGVVWWGAAITTRLDALERQLSAASDTRERLIRLEAMESMSAQTLVTINRRLERMEAKSK